MKITEKTTRLVFTNITRRQFEFILEDNTKLTDWGISGSEDEFIYNNKLGVVGEWKETDSESDGFGVMYPVNLLRKPEFESEELWSPWQHKSWRKV